MSNLGSNQRLIDEMPGNGGSGRAATFPRLLSVPDPSRHLSTAELAECTCPEFCERDHDTD
jgi:hypothetical protein